MRLRFLYQTLLVFSLHVGLDVPLPQADGNVPLLVHIGHLIYLVSQILIGMPTTPTIPTLLCDLDFRLAFSSISDLIIAKVLLGFFPAYSNFFDILSDTWHRNKTFIIESANK